jgi:uroporphyrinogen decarboxylase
MDAAKPDKRRISAVFNHKLPDRVPNFEVLVDNPTLSYIMGRPIPDHTLDNIPPEDYMEFARRIGQDVIGMCFYASPYRYEAADGSLKPLDFRITNREELKRLVKPDISWLEERFALLDRYEQAVKGTDTGLFVLLGSFFTEAYDTVFGFENFMCTLFDDMPLIEEVLEIGAYYCEQIAKRVVQKDLTFFYVGDDIAFKSTTLVNPKILRDIWIPRMKRVFQPALDKGIPILFHSDGNIQAMIPDMIDLGISALNPIEPYGMEITEIKREYGRDIALVGNLDVGGSLSRGTVDDVRRDARALIDTAGRDGGLVLASSHSITKNVKPENFLAMVETAQTYGRY